MFCLGDVLSPSHIECWRRFVLAGRRLVKFSISSMDIYFIFLFFFYNSFVIKDREYMYIAAKANTRHDPIYKIK